MNATPGRFRLRSLDRIRGDEVEANVLRLGSLLLRSRKLDQLRDERRHLAELLHDVGEEPAALLRRSARSPASTSMFVRRHVSGVRNSCDASATSCRWARFESSSPASIVLKLVARRLSSSRPLTLDALGEIARLRDALRRLRQPANRSECGARDDEPERGGDADSGKRDGDQEQANPSQSVVHLGQRTRDLDGVPGLVRDG